jgi:hypothetical protein
MSSRSVSALSLGPFYDLVLSDAPPENYDLYPDKYEMFERPEI